MQYPMTFPRQPRKVERSGPGWTTEVKVDALENDQDQNDREHIELKNMISAAVNAATEPLKVEIKELKTKVDRLTWALASAALSFGIMTITFIMTRS